MYSKDQESNRNAFSSGAHLTKEEMRQKIRASLAAKESNGQQPEEHAPAYAGSVSRSQPVRRSAGSNATPAEHSRTEKARQLRETMDARRGSGNGRSMRGEAASDWNPPVQRKTAVRPQPQPRPQRREAYEDWDYDERVHSTDAGKKIGIITGIIVAAILVLFYVIGLVMYHGKFLPKTYVNNVNISGMTAEEATKAITDSAEELGVTFIPRQGDPIVFKGSSFGCTVSLPDGALSGAADEGHSLWFRKLFSKSEYAVTLNVNYSEANLASLIAAYDWGNVPPTDAKVVQGEDGSFSIQPEDDGNMVDTTVLSNYTIEQMRNGSTTINMVDANCYKKAEVTADSLKDTLALYNQIGAVEITYDMTNREELFDPVGTETVGHEQLMQWITSDGDQISIDKEKAKEWVQTNIADKYDTFKSEGYTRTFESTADGTVELALTPTSTYGWKTDVDATVDKLEEYIQDGESVTVEPEYEQAGFRPKTSSGKEFGEKTYIEVDICHQHLWFYVDGELYLESDVVTGLDSDVNRQTHPGVFKIRDRVKDAVLGTYAVQGYQQPVSYWMPIDHTGIGLHDLNRSKYGGEIYKTHGSHGCINLPLDVAGKIYEETVVGMPVIIVP